MMPFGPAFPPSELWLCAAAWTRCGCGSRRQLAPAAWTMTTPPRPSRRTMATPPSLTTPNCLRVHKDLAGLLVHLADSFD